MGNRVPVVCRLALMLLAVLVVWIAPTEAQLTSTTTKLTLSSAGNAVSTVTAGTKVTLTATASAGSTPATVGLVTFCDAAATDCTAFHRIGAAQLTSSGSAVINVVPSPGTHSYKAVFAGTPNGTAKLAGSTSSASTLTVNASLPTTTAMAVTGNAGNYTLTATVSGNGSAALSGSTSFVDTSNNNQVLGTKTLTGNTTVLQVINSSNPPQGDTPWSATTGDFNRDGIPDVAVGDSSDQNLSIYLGNGDGTFAPVILVTLPAPLIPLYVLSISTADFNQDGTPDLVVSDGASVFVLLGKGDGTFTATTSTPILVNQPSTALSGVATVGDFNCDGIPDIAVATNAAAGGYFTVMAGNGDGTFAVNTTLFAPDVIECDSCRGFQRRREDGCRCSGLLRRG